MTRDLTPLMSIEDMEQLRLERLQSTLNRAYKNVPFHRRRFERAGRLPSDIQSVADIRALPFMDRTDLCTHYPYGLFAVPLRDIVRIHTAPGTGESPSISGYTGADLLIWKKIVARSLVAAGVTDMDIIQIHLPPGLANWGRNYKDGGETIGAGVIPNSELSFSKSLMVLKDYKTTTLITLPAFAEQLAKVLFDTGRHPNELNLKRVILVGEPVDREQARDLSQRLHVDVWSHYGLSEIPGPAIAHECPSHEGLHINDDLFLAEIVDPSTGNPVPRGQSGELVLTTLSARAFPLIRFKTGDRACVLTDDCGCASPFSRISWSGGSDDNMLILSGIRVSPAQVKSRLCKELGRPDLECTLAKLRRCDRDILKVNLCMDDALFSDEIKELEKVIRHAESALGEQTGIPVSIALVQPAGGRRHR